MQQRYYALDVFRGATVALMILVNNPGSWAYMYPPLQHAKWHGCTPTDLVFPFFLFAVGNAMAFVMPKFEKAGSTHFLKKLSKRALLIFLIGLLLNWSPFVKWQADELVFKNWENVRILGVLQRIAICYFFAGLIVFYGKRRGAILISIVLLLIYWVASAFLGNPAAPYSLQGFFGTAIDLSIIGETHLYKGEGVPFDPEGLMSSTAAIVQVIIGYLAGKYIIEKGKTAEMLAGIFVGGSLLLLGGFVWDYLFPINKKIWTSSYTIYTAGLAMLCLGLCIYLLELDNQKGRMSEFFNVFGKNPLFIFVLSGVLPRLIGLIRFNEVLADGSTTYNTPLSVLYKQVCVPLSNDQRVGSFVYALLLLTFYWLLAYWMDKKRIYIKV